METNILFKTGSLFKITESFEEHEKIRHWKWRLKNGLYEKELGKSTEIAFHLTMIKPEEK